MNKENIKKIDMNEALKQEMAKATKILEKSEATLQKESLLLSYENDDLEYLSELLSKAKNSKKKAWKNDIETYEIVENLEQ
jgi:glutaredoxin 2